MLNDSQCLICSVTYKNNRTLRTHVYKKHKIQYTAYVKQYNLEKPPINIICAYCGKPAEDVHYNAEFCGARCRQDAFLERQAIERNKDKNPEDLRTCKICGLQGEQLTTHVIRKHHMTLEEYYRTFNCTFSDICNEKILGEYSERISGDKNPGYQHGGKYSIFSENNPNFDPVKKQIATDKMKITKAKS